MRFEEACGGWQARRLTQDEAARLLGVRERTVGRDNCVSFESERLQIPAHTHRYHFVKARVRVHRYPDGRLAVFHGPRKLADCEPDGSLVAGAEATGQDTCMRTRVAR